jgi:hypothetical protein
VYPEYVGFYDGLVQFAWEGCISDKITVNKRRGVVVRKNATVNEKYDTLQAGKDGLHDRGQLVPSRTRGAGGRHAVSDRRSGDAVLFQLAQQGVPMNTQ